MILWITFVLAVFDTVVLALAAAAGWKAWKVARPYATMFAPGPVTPAPPPAGPGTPPAL